MTPAGGAYRPEKIWRALAAVTKEKTIAAHLANLERGKSALALCIETIDSKICIGKESRAI